MYIVCIGNFVHYFLFLRLRAYLRVFAFFLQKTWHQKFYQKVAQSVKIVESVTNKNNISRTIQVLSYRYLILSEVVNHESNTYIQFEMLLFHSFTWILKHKLEIIVAGSLAKALHFSKILYLCWTHNRDTIILIIFNVII